MSTLSSLHGLAPSYLADEQQSQSFEGLHFASTHELSVPRIPDSQPTATELFQSPLYGSGTVFRSISHLLRHFLSSALALKTYFIELCYP